MDHHPDSLCPSSSEWMESPSDGCKNRLFEWRSKGDMSQPEGFVVKGQEHKVCKLIKSLYGLKQAPRSWYEKLTENLLKIDFKHFDLDDATLFVE